MSFWKLFLIILILSSTLCKENRSINNTNGNNMVSEKRVRQNKNVVMNIFSHVVRSPGPCRTLPTNQKQNRMCRRDTGLPDAILEAKRIATKYCEDQFRFDRWNCSIETRGKGNIFKKVYRETAFVHALTAAAITYTVSRACSEGKMTRCQCATENRPEETRMAWRWGGCSDNVKHGKRIARNFLDLQPKEGDEIAELLRHDSEVGIQAVISTMADKCKCHGVSGSCSMKTCYKKLGEFNDTTALLRQKYHQAVRKMSSNNKPARRAAPKRRRLTPYNSLYYLETSPTFCSVTRGRRCHNSQNCATLCCGRGYVTKVFRVIEKCRCRFHNNRCCILICDHCERLEDRYFCK